MVKKKITKVLIVAVITIFLLVIGGGIWMKKRDSFPSNSPQKTNDNYQKKELAEKIKNDLTTDFTKLKKGYIQAPKHWSDYVLSGNEEIIFCWIKDFEKHIIKKTDLLPNDWAEIVKKIKQLDQAKEEKFQAKNSEMSTNPNLFLYEHKVGISENTSLYHGFVGEQSGKEYYLLIPTNHPAPKNIDLKEDNWEEKRGTFYLITGVENIPLQTSPSANRANKIVKSSDQITIKLEN